MSENAVICGSETALATSHVSALKRSTTITDSAAASIVGIVASRRSGLARRTARPMAPESSASIRAAKRSLRSRADRSRASRGSMWATRAS